MGENVFISVSSKDSVLSDQFYKFLLFLKYSVGYYKDSKTLQIGDFFWKKILEKINNTDFFIAFLSKKYLESKSCKKELRRAYLLEKFGYLKIFPILISNLKKNQYIKLKPKNKTEVLSEILHSLGAKKVNEKLKKISKVFTQIPIWAVNVCLSYRETGALPKNFDFAKSVKVKEALYILFQTYGCSLNFDEINFNEEKKLLLVAKEYNLSFLGKLRKIPNRNLTRIELAELIPKLGGWFFEQGKRINKSNFNDIAINDPNRENVLQLIKSGLMNVTKKGYFSPQKEVKGYEFIYIVAKSAIYIGANGGGLSKDLFAYVEENKDTIEMNVSSYSEKDAWLSEIAIEKYKNIQKHKYKTSLHK